MTAPETSTAAVTGTPAAIESKLASGTDWGVHCKFCRRLLVSGASEVRPYLGWVAAFAPEYAVEVCDERDGGAHVPE